MTPQQLKNSILQLAIQGKLVEQRPEEGTGQELFNQIQEEKQKLIAEGKIKKEKELAPITEDEIPFDIPKNWSWVKLNSLCLKISDGTHKTPKYVDKGVPFLSVQNISSGILNLANVKYISENEHENLIKRINPQVNDILVCRIGTLGKAIKVTWNFEFSIFVSLGLIRCENENIVDYLVEYINSPICWEWILKKRVGGGTHTYKINLKDLSEMIIPLPPLAEQKRIVAKIEELLPYVDKYQEYYDELESLNSKFPGQLRKSILQYAIEGKLVEQRPEEGTGQDLFNQIQEEKQKLIAEGKIKKEKALAPITEDEIPFDIPESWRWCRLVSLFQFINGDRGKNYPSKDKLKTKGIPFISAINLKDGKILHDEKLMCLSNEQYDLLSSGKLQKNDIVICIRGSLGKHAVFTEEQGAIASSLVILRQPKKLNSMVSYVSYFIDSKLFFDEISQTDNGTAQPNLSSKNLENFIFPLPPLAEQKRIVSKVEELFALCDKLDLS